MKSLVIVESPAKAKTINKILGKDYEVVSSMGHVVDLPQSKMGIDIERDFKPEYIVIPERRKNLAQLKRHAKAASAVYLAPDPDREGEAISWHLRNNLMDKKKKFYRVSFDEITPHAVSEAFRHPREIDMNLVNAQQARRIMDRIVGYSLSPLLWKHVSRGLSAGRVQSVAVRLVVDREREIQAFIPQEYWEIDADLKRREDSVDDRFKAKLDKCDDKKVEIRKREEADRVVAELKKESFIVGEIRETTKKKSPFAPFTTSTMQQDAFNKLRFSASKTMNIAQTLYEGVQLGKEEAVGLITYMRTDSVRISSDAQKAARNYILDKYGKSHYPEVPNFYRSKKGAQEAHEAIRPTIPLREPEKIRHYLTPDQLKLYSLIWNRFVASQMSQALYSVMSVDIIAGRYLLKASDTTLVFDGFTAVYGPVDSEDKSRNKIPPLKKGERLDLLSLIPSQHFTKPPARYSDASLVKALEEKGIGRPSTYAPTIRTVIDRNYVERISGYLKPTELGFMVTDLLMEHFPKILDLKFTAKMEDELDGVEEGAIDYLILLRSFYSPFMHTLEEAKTRMKGVKKKEIVTDEVCELCGRPMVIKWGRRGKFLSCSGFPACKHAESITSGVKCPQPGCGGELVQRRSRRGPFYGCTNYPRCTFTARRLPTQEKAEGPKVEEA